MSSTTTLAYAVKFVRDMDAAVRFHVEELGLTLRFTSPEWSEFDTGTTTLALVRHLRKQRNLTIATNNLRIPAEISPNVLRDLYVFGGSVRTVTQTTTGPLALRLGSSDREIEVRSDIAFIGVGAVSPTSGYSTSNVGDADMMAAMIARSSRVAILADSSKFGRDLFAQVATIAAADYFITDARPPADLVAEFEAGGVEVIVADQ